MIIFIKKIYLLKNLFYELVEFYLRNSQKLIYSDIYSYFLKKINEIKKFNLDIESFFIEFESKLLNG